MDDQEIPINPDVDANMEAALDDALDLIKRLTAMSKTQGIGEEIDEEDSEIDGTNFKNKREAILCKAEKIINGDRNVQYGDPNADFKRIAAYWNIHLKAVFERKVTEKQASDRRRITDLGVFECIELIGELIDPWDVAIMMDQMKTSRLAHSPHKADNWADKVGYSGCGFDVSKAKVTDLP